PPLLPLLPARYPLLLLEFLPLLQPLLQVKLALLLAFPFLSPQILQAVFDLLQCRRRHLPRLAHGVEMLFRVEMVDPLQTVLEGEIARVTVESGALATFADGRARG